MNCIDKDKLIRANKFAIAILDLLWAADTNELDNLTVRTVSYELREVLINTGKIINEQKVVEPKNIKE